MKTNKRFLAVYAFYGKCGNGFGNCDVLCNWDIPRMESIRDIERQICEANDFTNVVVLNLIKLIENEGEESEDTR